MSNIDTTPIKTKNGKMLFCPNCDSGFHTFDAVNCWNCGKPLEIKKSVASLEEKK